MPSKTAPSAFTSLPSTVPVTVIFPPTLKLSVTSTVPALESKTRFPLAVLTSFAASKPTRIFFTNAPPGTVC